MPESIGRPEYRSIAELLKGLKRSIKQAKEGENKHWKDVKESYHRDK